MLIVMCKWRLNFRPGMVYVRYRQGGAVEVESRFTRISRAERFKSESASMGGTMFLFGKQLTIRGGGCAFFVPTRLLPHLKKPIYTNSKVLYILPHLQRTTEENGGIAESQPNEVVVLQETTPSCSHSEEKPCKYLAGTCVKLVK